MYSVPELFVESVQELVVNVGILLQTPAPNAKFSRQISPISLLVNVLIICMFFSSRKVFSLKIRRACFVLSN